MDRGSTLGAAFRAAGQFPDYVCGLIEVGERTGRTEEALNALEKAEKADEEATEPAETEE